MTVRMVNDRLGGYGVLKHRINNDFDLARLASNGVPKASIQHLADSIGMDSKVIVDLLPVTARNLQRYNDSDLLSNVVSDHLIALADLFSVGVTALSKDYFQSWLTGPIPSLGNESPIYFLKTHAGIELIKTELGRIEHGIFA
ncbi:hypothetical protein DYBT9623_01938 [Dyadobacter sp. CECT 9623]|jgi:putative toxin-antitoxin system antitoxin component (TIGR02293 family)|uniref:Antitoxin Xre/MbcA/ParS-like toxin-binding domain-containing protein n=1 Tax=Dyadobacter linearis TaxID=2823330 RepID=A0ABM8UP23_9BACT|nr:antitoxin Xre/MbcA/ParS toxin-binding domain-containing protein [Dyadobacter sp. CECT 9623]CAG5069202.1 hypothetical protein DYBT9623_01938 [Dyadobacter sp. CECT 9623]